MVMGNLRRSFYNIQMFFLFGLCGDKKHRQPSCLQKLLYAIGAVSAVVLVWLILKVTFDDTYNVYSRRTAKPPVVDYVCTRSDSISGGQSAEIFANTVEYYVNTKTEDKVLLLVETLYSGLGQQLVNMMDAVKFQYTAKVMGKGLPALTTTAAKGRYSVIVFENLYRYLNMDQWNRQLLDKYCRDYGASIIAFMPNRQDLHFERAKVRGFPLTIYQNLRISDMVLQDTLDGTEDMSEGNWHNWTLAKRKPSFFYMTKSGQSSLAGLYQSHSDWVGFDSKHKTYESIVTATALPASRQRPETAQNPFEQSDALNVSLVLLDKGEWDGVRRAYFGNDFASMRLMKLLFLDALRYLSNGRLTLSLVRYVLIDIDDIFVGEKGYKMISDDVNALVESQERLRAFIDGFTYNLGFSGKFFRRGSRQEVEGDNMLVQRAQNFWWFPHQWRHTKPHKWNMTQLETFMLLNQKFAEEYKLPVRHSYAVSPHHSGVYPVHEPLYDVWKKVWNVRVTSTEEYPHLRPASLRRGFIHRDIMVLPRQTCGLYTHTVFMDSFPGGGRVRLDQSIKGGDLFYTFIYNPFLIFMTHQANYANDRLASYTFETEARFLQCWTNLRLKTISPLQMAEKYFRRYPEERDAVWVDPCLDKRHLDIWSSEKSCTQLPKVLVLGPQKTGTTALYTFLKLHPMMRSNENSPTTFEEIQFFNGKLYRNGLDWYMSFFRSDNATNDTEIVYFEKSATYFDSELAPRRVHALLPRVKLIAIMISPAKRAYSWYQHAKAHKHPAALTNGFLDVLKATEDSTKEIWQLRQHCLHPGNYVQHIERWLSLFSSKQLLIIDGEQLKSDPVSVMSSVQEFLALKQRLNYTEKLRYSTKKGFYCVASESDRPQCLGGGKGRKYEPMSDDARRYLVNYFRPHNIALHRLLTRLGYSTPKWLQQELEETL